MKNSFKFKRSFYNLLLGMTDKQAGEFIKGMCDYAFNEKHFQTKDDYLKGAFLYVQRELDVSKQNSINGKKGGLVSAEMKRNEERKTYYDDGVITGGIVAGKTMQNLLRTLKKG